MRRYKIHLTIGLICLMVIGFFIGQVWLEKTNVPIVSNEVEDITKLTTEEKVNDFLYLYEIFDTSYPYFGILQRTKGIDWLGNKDEYVQRIKETKNNLAYYTELSNILKELQQGHTNIVHPASYDYYLEVYTGKFSAPWRGVLSHKNTQTRYQYWKRLLDVKDQKKSVRERAAENRKGNVTYEILSEDKIAYMKVKSLNTLYIEEDGKEILEFFQSIKDYPNLIIDIRGNGGGSSNYWEKNIVEPLLQESLTVEGINIFRGSDYLMPFINSRVTSFKGVDSLPNKAKYPVEVVEKKMFSHYFTSKRTTHPRNSVGFKGEVYLLVDERVYSSSEGFAIFAKDTNWATLVGTKTGGDGMGFDPILVSLPYSGLVIRFPGTMGLVGDGSANEETKTLPHVVIDPEKSEDALEKTLEIINNK